MPRTSTLAKLSPPRAATDKLTINDVRCPTSKAVAGQRLLEARCKPEPVEAVLKLRVWESRLLISTEDWRLELLLLPAQRRAQDRAPDLVLKDSPGGGQARRLKSAVCEGEGYEVRDGTEDRVVYFGKEEYRTVRVR
jgi:hypothetical protein